MHTLSNNYTLKIHSGAAPLPPARADLYIGGFSRGENENVLRVQTLLRPSAAIRSLRINLDAEILY